MSQFEPEEFSLHELTNRVNEVSKQLSKLQNIIYSINYTASQRIGNGVQLNIPLETSWHFTDLQEAFKYFITAVGEYNKNPETPEYQLINSTTSQGEQNGVYFTGELYGNNLALPLKSVASGNNVLLVVAVVTNEDNSFTSVLRLLAEHLVVHDVANTTYSGMLN